MPHHANYARQAIGDIAPKLAELITHLAFYAGWPCAFPAIERLRAERAA